MDTRIVPVWDVMSAIVSSLTKVDAVIHCEGISPERGNE